MIPEGHDGPDSLTEARARYAERLRFAGRVGSEAVVRAFASVPRERFLGPGPWRVRDAGRRGGYRTTPDADPRHVYHNVLVALDEARSINNGSPSLWAVVLDRLDIAASESVLHLGCGTGYYSAILAELVGVDGHVDRRGAGPGAGGNGHARRWRMWPQVVAVQADGAAFASGPQRRHRGQRRGDASIAGLAGGAAARRPAAMPLTTRQRGGFMLKRDARAAARRQAGCGIAVPRLGLSHSPAARDAALGNGIGGGAAPARADVVRSLRLDPHVPDGSCWLHGDGFCLSCLTPIRPMAHREAHHDVSPRWHPESLAARLPFLRRRARLTAATRAFFTARGYTEVETPYAVASARRRSPPARLPH